MTTSAHPATTTRRRVALATATALAVTPLLLAGPASAAGAAPAQALAATAEVPSHQLWSDVEDGVTRSGARRMRTQATFHIAERRVTALTRTWNGVALTGFTGAVQLVFLDANDRVIGAGGVRTYGVDGTWIGRYDRTDYWEEHVDGPWMADVASVRVVHSHAGKVRLKEIVAYAVDTASPVVDLVNRLNAAKPAS
ncbi:hypothetical protein [Vallicoccus soli]|uniref:Uncharacterized protein n=1 Tax=Vallicoccus soli TaxID=2339232 RepID=A0A3A3Z343_9ACTN|nr:hypothetical protein [Vallicoccus soli]RJK94881.1 hypothetical protein D5H78_13885 [Vallicoccus soli]